MNHLVEKADNTYNTTQTPSIHDHLMASVVVQVTESGQVLQYDTDPVEEGHIQLDELPETSNTFPVTKKTEVVLHVTILKVGEINTLNECFVADILILSRWRVPQLDNPPKEGLGDVNFKRLWNPKIFIENTEGEPKVTSSIFLEYTNDNLAYVMERKRFKATFMENLELLQFPFDVQDLSINIMSELPSSEIILAETDEQVHGHRIHKQSFIDEQEWYLYKYIESEIKECSPDEVNPSFTTSSLTIRAKIARRPAYYIWNIFSVIFLISSLSFVTFAVDAKLPHRLTLSFTLILTAVAFKFTVNQTLPRIPYLTFLDQYILSNLFLLTLVAMWHGAQMGIAWAGRHDYYAMIAFATYYCCYNVTFIVRIFTQPYSTRRRMNKLEADYMQAIKLQSQDVPLDALHYSTPHFFTRARKMFKRKGRCAN